MASSENSFRAIQFSQGVGTGAGQKMYLFAAPASWLIRRAKIDRWRPQDANAHWQEQGYQRELSDSHLKAICRYLKGTLKVSSPTNALPIFPTSVLLSVRQSVDFRPSSHAGQKDPRVCDGTLELPEGMDIFIIDGQHRIEGLKAFLQDAGEEGSLFANYPLPVTLMVCENKIHEILHFLIINKEAKSVRTDLAERLLDTIYSQDHNLIRDPRIRIRATENAKALSIARRLEETPDQPWFGRIAKPNQRAGKEMVAKEGQFCKSLRHILANVPLGWDPERTTTFIIDFWTVLSELLPEAFENPAQYTIQRAVGFGCLHRVLPRLVHQYEDAASLRQILEGTDPFFTDSEYWRRGGEASQYSSESAYKIQAERILEAIEAKFPA